MFNIVSLPTHVLYTYTSHVQCLPISHGFLFLISISPHLRELMLNNNQLRLLPYELGRLIITLQVLGLKGNPLASDVMGIYNEPKGTHKLLSYMLDHIHRKFHIHLISPVPWLNSGYYHFKPSTCTCTCTRTGVHVFTLNISVLVRSIKGIPFASEVMDTGCIYMYIATDFLNLCLATFIVPWVKSWQKKIDCLK